MLVVSYPHLILPLLLVTCCIIGESHANRQRRQATGGDNRNLGNSNGYLPQNNVQFNPSNNQNIPASNVRNDQQLSGNSLSPSSQGQGQPVRSRGFYDSPSFKPPTFSGEKPVGWFDTKYQGWVSNQNTQLDKNIDGKNAPPASLQGEAIQSRREDGGALFLQKAARLYMSKGEKAYNFGQFNPQKKQGSVCTNHQNFDGYTFGKFPCPLPPNSGMNQLDQFCCGPANYQYCCNAREFNLNQGIGFGNSNQRHPKSYAPSRNRALAIVLPIAGILVVAGALIIVFLYYKKIRQSQSTNIKSKAIRSNESYSAVSQVPPAEQPSTTQREQQKTTVNA